ncbi:hypothetical protein TH66_11720 [Carbonactinospora thermoautotrophica]|uniref:ABC-2 type transporter n=1 Tax=Carbonactinospora thermoautotrophica TaxID=1469144 RepID=A0A132MXB6_9ACTN|nr:ABC transporter permease [Carbonactinospora thermoautotrophica]KWX02386.1 ABC-2 type transporter [Carbonactinospora thermoautotrophica]KWX03534.1 hypothetical protein TH66_11720 [Carbonactinospora thermoautotrophica]KWX10036.1 hypothetical protein TR74_06050 [Carbonactinospora thermoautotrophica]
MGTGTRVQVYEPYSYQLPPLGPYLKDLWARRRFAFHMARSTLKGRHYDTVFGQLWLVINPLLLGAVYFLVVTVLSGGNPGAQHGQNHGKLDHFVLILLGLFAYYYTRNVIQLASTSVTGSGKIIMNIPFPKALLPLSSLFSSILMYLPMLVVYAVAHAVAGRPVTVNIWWAIPVFLIQTVFSFAWGMFFAALSVYFRDTSSFLPYLLRIWIYISPVLYTVEQIHTAVAEQMPWARWILEANPLTPILGAWQQVVFEGKAPDANLMWQGLAWAIGSLVVGGWYFLSREREFAVRI